MAGSPIAFIKDLAMLLSLFTPTHNTEYLLDTFESVIANTFTDWEWVILPNGDAVVPEVIRDHPQVRIINGPTVPRGIGQLKRLACMACRGDYLVELDHDDQLTPNAMQIYANSIAEHPTAGFFYSDSVHRHENGSSQLFTNVYGWEQYPVEIAGEAHTVMRAFEPSAASLQQILFAPDHVRIWKRDAYAAVGGHDPALAVADDHDLICRTYLAKYEFVHIPKCTYVYRLQAFDKNTFLQQNADIQKLQQTISNKYTYQLIDEWCRREGLPRVSFGNESARQKTLRPSLETVCRDGFSLDTDSVGVIRAYDMLHLIPQCRLMCNHETRDCHCVVAFMNECYRVLAPGGWLICSVVESPGAGAFCDPRTQSFWTRSTFYFYTHRVLSQHIQGLKARFAIAGDDHTPRLWTEQRLDISQQLQSSVFADLVALKGQRHPGATHI